MKAFENNSILGKYTENVAAVSRSIDARQEELKAAYDRIEELETALRVARCQLVTLGGDDPEGCQIQQAVLYEVNEALS